MVFKIFLIIFCLFLPFAVYASVIINEIAWMGTKLSYNDEWIELYNNTEGPINLNAWILKADDGTPEINLSGTIPANGFYLLERTDDETVPGISANLIYKGALGNNGENLKLYNASGNLIDEVNCSDGWPAGNNETKQTMEKTDSGNWQDSESSGGSPKAENSEQKTMNNEQKLPEDGPRVAEPVSYASGIVFNEILPSPDGPDAENEWIELYNQNDFDVDLSGWTIKDTIGSAKTYTLNAKIPANGYLVLLRPETKITLNNSGDGLNLTNPNGEAVDSVTFGKVSLDQSYNRTQSGWDWSTTLTPGAKNIMPSPRTKQEPSFAKASESKKKSETRSLETDFLAEEKTANYSIPLIALAIAISSAVVVLILKNLLDKS